MTVTRMPPETAISDFGLLIRRGQRDRCAGPDAGGDHRIDFDAERHAGHRQCRVGPQRAGHDRNPAIESTSTLSETPVIVNRRVGAQRAGHHRERFVVFREAPALAGGLGALTTSELLEREPQRWPPRVAPGIGRKHGAADREGAADRSRHDERARRAMGQDGDRRTRDQQRDAGGERDLRSEQADGRTGEQTDGGDGGDRAHTGERCKLRRDGSATKDTMDTKTY